MPFGPEWWRPKAPNRLASLRVKCVSKSKRRHRFAALASRRILPASRFFLRPTILRGLREKHSWCPEATAKAYSKLEPKEHTMSALRNGARYDGAADYEPLRTVLEEQLNARI